MITSTGRITLFLGLLLVCLNTPEAHAKMFIIGSNDLSIETLTPKQIQELYLGKINTVHGEKVTLVDCDHSREDFLSEFVGVSTNHYIKTWVSHKSEERSTAPIVLKNCPEVIQYIKKHSKAIGYINIPPTSSAVKTLHSN